MTNTENPSRVALIADDDEELRDLMSEMLEEFGYSSIKVNDGKACIEKLREEVPVDVVFLDLKMAPQDGLSTLKIMRSFTNQVRHLPAFMLTGYVDDRIVAAAKNLGAADYLVKPIDPERLRERLFTKVREPVLLLDHKESLSTIYFEDKGLLAGLKDPVISNGYKAYPLTTEEDKWIYVVKQESSLRAIIQMKPEQQVASLLIYKKEPKGWRCVWPSYRQGVEATVAAKVAPKGLLGELGIA